MKKFLNVILRFVISFFLFIPTWSIAQSDIEMADTFRDEGKIYIVIAVIGVILIGLLIYLFILDRKISNLEKRKREED